MFKAISMGWGVQSWTMAAMVALGELPPVDAVVHSDTGHERARTYAFAQEWTPWLQERGVNVVTVTATEPAIRGNHTPIPAYKKGTGKLGPLRRQCTSSWKITPIRRYLRESRRDDEPVELWLGITTDEWHRAKDSDVGYVTHRFPFIELNVSRRGCLNWLAAHGLPSPGRSSCVFCPFLGGAEWEEMRAENGEDWQKALEVDNAIRDLFFPSKLYLHRQGKPLSEAVAPGPHETGNDLDAECDSGHCFL